MWLLDAYCFCRDEMAPNLLRQGMLKTHSDTWPATQCACATFGHVDVQETLRGHWQLFFSGVSTGVRPISRTLCSMWFGNSKKHIA